MEKRFFDVFPGLNVAEPLKELLEMVQVERVTAARDRSSIRIYLKSTRLIHKHNIYDLERGIKEQLFPDKQLTIKIQEKYRLSDQYTPKKLLELYRPTPVRLSNSSSPNIPRPRSNCCTRTMNRG